jgi:hypothetical protein
VPTPEGRVAHSRELFAKHDDLVAAHWQEPQDAAWASSATQAISDAMTERCKNLNARVDQIDCRTNTCVATVLYSSYAEAIGSKMAMAQPILQEHCGANVADPPPTNFDAPYSATIVFTCERR